MLTELKKIVGSEYAAVGAEAAAAFTFPGASIPRMITVAPASTEEVQAIVKLARKKKIPIYTVNDRYLPLEDIDKEGLLIYFQRMNKIPNSNKTIQKSWNKTITISAMTAVRLRSILSS